MIFDYYSNYFIIQLVIVLPKWNSKKKKKKKKKKKNIKFITKNNSNVYHIKIL